MKQKRWPNALLQATLLTLMAGTSLTAQANECASISDNMKRLACFDSLFPGQPVTPEKPGSNAATGEASQPNIANEARLKLPTKTTSRMSDEWDLDSNTSRKSFELRTYKPTYLLLGTYTDHINLQPTSSNKANSVNNPIDLKAGEAQFQLSFKTRALHNIFGDNGSLWLGYTQSSRWQIYNGDISRPFRETNYEPEAMLVFRTPLELGGWNLRMSGIGLNHQSNGRSNPLSRSWNRVIAQFGFEYKDFSMQIRPWWRIAESDTEDNNPGIENYIGRGELILSQHLGEHVIALQGRHSLRSGDESRGSIKLSWSIPINGNLKGYLTAFSGYGESLIDYNHRQTMIGAGVSLVDW